MTLALKTIKLRGNIRSNEIKGSKELRALCQDYPVMHEVSMHENQQKVHLSLRQRK